VNALPQWCTPQRACLMQHALQATEHVIVPPLSSTGLEYVGTVKDPFNLPSELPLYRFAGAEDIKQWSVYSDAELGGSTSAALVPCDSQQACRPCSPN
jgi:hypothetical protein